MPWPSNSHELEAQLRGQAGDWYSRDTLLYCGTVTNLGASAPQGTHRTEELKLRMVPFQQCWTPTQGLACVQNVVFKKQKNSTVELQMVSKHLRRPNLTASEGSIG